MFLHDITYLIVFLLHGTQRTSCEGPSAGADPGILKEGRGGGGGIWLEIYEIFGRINYASIILVCQIIWNNGYL